MIIFRDLEVGIPTNVASLENHHITSLYPRCHSPCFFFCVNSLPLTQILDSLLCLIQGVAFGLVILLALFLRTLTCPLAVA